MSAGSPVSATAERLLAAATELFAARGFHATSIRDIAAHARVNVAAGHYHYGSKETLYLEVLRGQFARVQADLARRGALVAPSIVQRAAPARVRAILEARLAAMLDFLLGPPPAPHGALLMREMCDPTSALPIILDEFIRPQLRDMRAVVARLAPRASRQTVDLAVYSMIAQVIFYRFNLPMLLPLMGRRRLPRGFTRTVARHVTRFSLAGLAEVGKSRRERRRG